MNHKERMNTYKLFRLAVVAALAALALFLTGAHVARADPGVIYVDKGVSGSTHDGLSWTTAYTNVQDALAVAVYGDEIWVAEGVYYPDEGAGQTGDDRTSTFTLKPGVALYGGFGGSEMLRDWITYPTVLSGDIDGNDTTNPDGVVTDTANISDDNAYHVLYLNGMTSRITETTVIDGFVVTAGYANGSSPNHLGGGLYCVGNGSNGECSPTLNNVTFSGNRATDGGGMCNNGYNGGVSNPALTNVIFSGNRADGSGGGMYNWGLNGESSPSLTNVTFNGNLSTVRYGGGMYNNGRNGGASSPMLTNVTFNGNLTQLSGGGMCNDGRGGVSSPTLINVTFSGNRAASNGGGMYSDGTDSGASSPTLVNGILWGNNASAQGHQLYNANATLELSYTLIQSGTNHIVGGTVTYGLGMLTDDPQFIAPIAASQAPTTTGNYRLDFGSPAIDAGNSLSITSGVDLDSNPRIVGGVVDMGAYEAIPDLVLSKSVTSTTDVLYHGVVTYTVVLSNTGVGSEASVVVTDTLPTDVVFKDWIEQPVSGLVRSGNAITWTGSVSASSSITFTFTVTRTGSVGGDIVNTAYFSGTLHKGQAAATFMAGSMVCGVESGQLYTFDNQSAVSIQIATLGSQLGCLYVDEIGVNHPAATGESGSSGIKTGRYWLIRGLQADRVTIAAGFEVTLTLPHTGLSDPQVCSYTGDAGYGWDCVADGADGSKVWRGGITSFSEWAVGEHVGPTAIALRRLTAEGGLWGAGVLLALGAFLTLGVVALRSQLITRAARYSRLRCAMFSCHWHGVTRREH